MPRRSLSFRASPGGLPVPRGLSCPVCLAPEGCPVLCLCLAPEGSWYPLTSPGKFFWGRKGSGCRCRAEGTEATATSTTCHSLLSSLHHHGLLSSLHCHGLQSSQLCHGLRHLFRSESPRPVVLSVSVPRGLQSTHPPSPVELLRLGTSLSGGGSNVSPLSCVSCVPASCVHIWFVSCPRLRWSRVNPCPAVLSRYVWFTCVL